MLTRRESVDLAAIELDCLTNHVLTLSTIAADGRAREMYAGIEQLRAAILRIADDIETMRIARVQ